MSTATDLDLDLTELLPTRGRTAAPLQAKFVRELNVADLAAPDTAVQTSAPLKRLRDSHHALARVLAVGTSETDAAAITGYSPSRISILKADPQFAELLEFYRGQGATAVADFRERMAGLGTDALQELHQRLDENPDAFSEPLLLEITKIMADRTGHAPAKGPVANLNVNVTLSEAMAKARERLAAHNAPKVIDHE